MTNDIFAQRDAAIESIVDEAEEKGWEYEQKPKYKIPRGCPPIDVEVRTPESRILYVILHGPRGFTDESAKRLMRAITLQIDATGDNRPVELYFNILSAKLEQLPPKCRQAALEYEKQQV